MSSVRSRRFSAHLLPAVVITVLLGAAVAAALTLFLTWLVLKIPPTGTLPAPGPDGTSPFLDVLKVALTVSAGIGGAVALVVAYRRQRHFEVDDAGRRSRYASAAQQLGDPQAAVRLAGVYAMAHLADEWAGQRQQCVDVLCAYLRLPWEEDPTQREPDTTTTEQTSPDTTEHKRTDGVAGQLKVTKTYSGRAGEREVRQTLVRVIASHLRPDTSSQTGSGISWSNLEIDLTNAALPNANFTRADFRGRTSFRRATFSGLASFELATFSDDASFEGARFPAGVSFGRATFFGDASFRRAILTNGVASFGAAEFTRAAHFDEASFGGAFFDVATFSNVASFAAAKFYRAAHFRDVKLLGETSFERAEFFGWATFSGASLPSRSVFASATGPPSEDALKQAVFRDEQPESPHAATSTS